MSYGTYNSWSLIYKYKSVYNTLKKKSDFNNFLKEKSYEIIKNSNLFDEDYYMNNYPETKDSDCINHYITLGYLKNYNPNLFFETKEYVKRHECELMGLNPFVHYILHNEEYIVNGIMNELTSNIKKLKFHDNIFNKCITIILPIDNFDLAKRCVESILKHTSLNFKLILFINNYNYFEFHELIQELKAFNNILVIQHDNENLIKLINEHIFQTEDDIILLNQSVVLTPFWIQKILIEGYSDESVATISPIYSYSKIFEHDNFEDNLIPSFIEKKTALNIYTPLIYSPCLFIKRDVLNKIGGLDEENFFNIYFSQIDFSIRVKNNGLKNLITGSSFIFQQSSFPISIEDLIKLNKKDYLFLNDTYINFSKEIELYLKKLCEIDFDKLSVEYFTNINKDLIKKNILYITSIKDGVPYIDNIESLAKKFNIFVITINNLNYQLWFIHDNKIISSVKLILNLNDDAKDYCLALFKTLHIDYIFLQYSALKLLDNSLLTPIITLASEIDLPILYGNNSVDVIPAILNIKSNENILLNKEFTEKNKGVVYTAIFSDYNRLHDPLFINPDLDYICFTDNPKLESKIWKICLIENYDEFFTMSTIKILPHHYLKEYDYSIWVDVNFQIIGDIKKYINIYSNGNPILSLIKLNEKYNYKNENLQMVTDILFRKHDNCNLNKSMEEWHDIIVNSNKNRDLNLYNIMSKNNVSVDFSNICYLNNCYFKYSSNNLVGENMNVHVFLINDNNLLVDKTINSIKSLNDNIPITVLNTKNHSIKNFLSKDSQIPFNSLNITLEKIPEKYVIFLHSGDLMLDNLLNYMNNVYIHELQDIGAIVFDSKSYYFLDSIDNFKPQFSPDFYLEHDYIKNSVILNKDAILSVGGFNLSLESNFIRDMILKLYNSNYEILKEDVIGFKLNSLNQDYDDENQKFLTSYIKSNNISAEVENSKPIYYTENKKASIIIPFKDQAEVTEKCILSILSKTTYSNYEILLVNNNSCEEKTKQFMDNYIKNNKISIIDYPDKFNYSKINNFATKYASGDVFIFLNNDTEIISEDWLNLLIGDAIQKNIGAVGSKLYYPDKTIQHIGVVIGLNGLAGHLFSGEIEENIPYHFKKYRRNVSAVTGACMAIEKSTFNEIGGFDELFDITGSDVEICLRLMDYGYRNIINPNVELIHYERKTRSGIRVRDIDIQLSIEYYGPYLREGDPYFNKKFSLNSNKLVLKEIDETPVFKDFLDDYYQQKMDKNNKLQKIVQTRKSIKNVRFDAEVLRYDISKNDLTDNAILMNKFFKNPNLELNNVMWFIPWFDLIYRGGIYTIFRIANYFSMTEKTHNIIVLDSGNKRNINEIYDDIREAFPNLDFEVIDIEEIENISDLPKSDAAFCTFWTTAYSLVKYNNCKAKFYLNQDYEPLFAAAGSVSGLIEETYRFNFIGLANSKGVGNKYKSYGNIVKYFTPAVDKSIYFPNNSKNDTKKRVVFYGRPTNPRNGFILGIEALKIVKSYFGDSVEIFSVGAEFNLEDYGLEGVITNLGLLDSTEKVANLYRQCDVGLVFMFTPHPSYQPLEYMACGCATVSNINENNVWLLKDKENCILSEPVISCVAENIIDLLEDDNMRKHIISNGLKTVKDYDWESVLKDISHFVKNPLE